jgi:hypothetical protein
MQLIQINNKPKLQRIDLKENCYYKFSNLPDYLFIFDKEYPNEIIPIINNDKEDLTIEYGKLIEKGIDILQYQFIEICELDNISYIQEEISNTIPYHKIKIEIIYSITSPNSKTNLINNKSKALILYNNNYSYVHFFHITNSDIINCNVYKLHIKIPIPIKEFTVKDISHFNERYWKQISFNKITFETID